MTQPRIAGFRLGVYVFKDAEIIDYAAPNGVLSVARRYDPEIDAFLVADAARPVQTQAGFTVLPNYSFQDTQAMDAFLIPGGFGTRQEMHNRRLHAFIRSLPETTLLTSVCTGSWVYGCMGLLDGVAATGHDAAEPDWQGATLEMRDATVHFADRRARCVFTMYDPDTIEQEPGVLRAIVRQLGGRRCLN